MEVRKSDGWGTSATPLLCGEINGILYLPYIYLNEVTQFPTAGTERVFSSVLIYATGKNTWVSLVRNTCGGHSFHQTLFPGLRRMDLPTISPGFTGSQKKSGFHPRPAKRYKKQQGVHSPMSPTEAGHEHCLLQSPSKHHPCSLPHTSPGTNADRRASS